MSAEDLRTDVGYLTSLWRQWEKEATWQEERADRAEADLTAAEAERDKLKADLSVVVIEVGAQARARGEAEGKLCASNLAGVVEGWQSRAYAAEAEVERVTAERDEARAEAKRLREDRNDWARTGLYEEDRATAAEAQVERLRGAVEAALAEAIRPSAIKLMAGEMTAQEARTAYAVAKGLAAKVRRALSSHEPQKGEDHA